MFFIQRVYLSIVRNIGKSITLFLIVSLLAIFLSASITIRNAIYQTEASLREKLPAVAIIDWEYRVSGYLDKDTR